MMYDLPERVQVCDAVYEIRSDYRAVLDICTALSDPELQDQDKSLVLLDIFYRDFSKIPQEHYQEAIRQCFWFINCGDEMQEGKAPRLIDWEQDFRYIVPSVNRVVGTEIRSMPYMHWWTFISAYYEIGDCLFAQIVRIRDKKVKGKPLDKMDREFYRKNQKMVDIKTRYTEREADLEKLWTGL